MAALKSSASKNKNKRDSLMWLLGANGGQVADYSTDR